MSRIRGQEVTLRFMIEGEAKVGGTWAKVKDFRATPRTEFREQGYLGEAEQDLDLQHNGFDVAFSADVEDAQGFQFLHELVAREREGLPPQRVTMTAIYAFRRNGQVYTETYRNVLLKVDESGAGGREEYVGHQFSGKCKRADLARAG